MQYIMINMINWLQFGARKTNMGSECRKLRGQNCSIMTMTRMWENEIRMSNERCMRRSNKWEGSVYNIVSR